MIRKTNLSNWHCANLSENYPYGFIPTINLSCSAFMSYSSELKESLTRVGADIKQKIVDSLKNTWNSINDFAKAHRSSEASLGESLEQQVDSQISSVMHDLSQDDDDKLCKSCDHSSMGPSSRSLMCEKSRVILRCKRFTGNGSHWYTVLYSGFIYYGGTVV